MIVYVAASPARRRVIWRTSLVTSLFGLTEPLFVPAYWNPPSLFDLAARTRFDLESLIFSFAIGGIGAASYAALTGATLQSVDVPERHHPRHKYHFLAVWGPFVLFPFIALLPWNPIYPAIACLLMGAGAAMICRPDLRRNIIVGGVLFTFLYGAFMLALVWSVPGFIARVWNLPALSGVLIGGIPLEELLFGAAFGAYWGGAYEHLTWHRTLAPVRSPSPETNTTV